MSINGGLWFSESFHRFAEEGMYNDEFVNGVPVLEEIENAQAFLFPSAIYAHISAKRFERLKGWRKKIDPAQTGVWVLGVCESNHWTAIQITWASRQIGVYDPMNAGMSARARRNSKVTSRSYT